MKSLGVVERAALAGMVLFLLGAVGATFIPTSPEGITCGQWFSREWDDETADDLVSSNLDIYDDLSGTNYGSGIAGQALGDAARVRYNQRTCDSALNTRRTVTFVLLGIAILVPIGTIFVTAGRRPRQGPPPPPPPAGPPMMPPPYRP